VREVTQDMYVYIYIYEYVCIYMVPSALAECLHIIVKMPEAQTDKVRGNPRSLCVYIYIWVCVYVYI